MIIIAGCLKHKLSKSQVNKLKVDYINATKIAAAGVITQYIFVNSIGKIVGNYTFLGSYRHSYGFLFSDFSFLSLYLASGAIMVFFIKRNHLGTNKLWIFEMAFLLLTSIITSARTGIASFIVVFSVYSFFKFIKLLIRGSVKSILLASVSFFCYYIELFFNVRNTW